MEKGWPVLNLHSSHYRPYIAYTSIGEDLSQSAVTVRLNDIVIGTVQANDTQEEKVTQKLPKVILEEGAYTLRFNVQKAGLYVQEVVFYKNKRLKCHFSPMYLAYSNMV